MMEARPLLVLGVAAAIGASAVQPAFPGGFLLLAAFALWLLRPTRRAQTGRLRPLAALALVVGAVSATFHAGASSPPVRSHTLRAIAMLEPTEATR